MTGITYSIADFVTGGPIVDLPVMEGAPWAAQLNRPDTVECTIDLRDPQNRALDLRSATEPRKALLFARNDDDVILAWGLIPDDGREWDEDNQTVTLSATGIGSSWLGHVPIGPAAALTADLVIDNRYNPALDTVLLGWSLGTIGKKLLAQALTWPGAPTRFVLPADEAGTHERTYAFSGLKWISKALDDLTNVENGPDFAFDAARSSDGLTLDYIFRHGSESTPRIGTHVGSWSLGANSPISGLKWTDAEAAGASSSWMTAGKQSGEGLMSRVVDETAIDNGYATFAVVDTTHSDVTEQGTLDAYNRQNMADGSTPTQDLSFTVRADATPKLGQYRPGDTLTLDVPAGHPWLPPEIPIRITSIKGDETGKDVQIGCVVLHG